MPRLARPILFTLQPAQSATYVCPVGGHGSADTSAAERWAACPLLDGNPICEGGCIDMQLVAREDDCAAAPFGEEFVAIATTTGRTVAESRLTCLQHQVELFEAEVARSTTVAAPATQALAEVRRLMRCLEAPPVDDAD